MRRLLAALLISICTATYSFASDRTLIINEDPGGIIDDYIMEIVFAVNHGVRKVIIDGTCVSACMLWIHSDFGLKSCATKNAKLGWHVPYYMKPDGTILVDNEAAAEMKAVSDAVINGFPELLKKHWQSIKIPSASAGDKPSDMVWVKGDDAVKMIGACDDV